MIRRLASSALALAVAVGASAQPAPERPGPGGRPERPPREDIFKMVDAYIISNLQESLGLDDAQFVRLLPLVKRLQTDRRALAQRRMRAMQELRRTLLSGTATDARVTELLKELKAVELEEPATVRRDIDAIDAALTPVQQAKYRILEAEVDRRLRELLNQVRRRAGEPPRARRDEPPPLR